jgi:ketosteroid isomerase-like protein
MVVIGFFCAASHAAAAQTSVSDVIIGLERAALDRWMQGDTSAYLALLAPDYTVFDPRLEARLTGRDAVQQFIERIRPKTPVPDYDIVNPVVQQMGDSAVLTFTFVSYDQTRTPTSRWNFTEVYRRSENRWLIVHSHASFVGGQSPGIQR